MIKDVDKSDVIGPKVIDSPFLGSIPVERLSGGVKTLILMNKDTEHIFNASACGDNCAKWILKLGENQDVTINLNHIMEFDRDNFEIAIINNDKIVHNMAELVDTAIDYL